jgi:hypothetical protein
MLLIGCVKTDNYESPVLQNKSACRFGKNMGMPIIASENDTTKTLKDIHRANHVYKCRCDYDNYIYKNDCYQNDSFKKNLQIELWNEARV